MQFTRLKLENFRCFGHIDTKFSNGVTVIHGINGAGKSSLLESCFFALYGSQSLGTDETLESVITKGEDNTTVELWFTHQNTEFRLEREIRWSDTTERATTATCVLEKAGTTIADGATNVENKVAELLRMDAESFLNCAYVRQGAITTLIDASPDERQDMIDELLQLGKLETYRERASKARIGIKRTREIRENSLQTLSDKIEDMDRDAIEIKLDSVQTELSAVKTTIDDFQAQRATFEQEHEEAKETVETVTEKQDELQNVQEVIGELNKKIDKRSTKYEQLEQTVDEKETKIDELQTEIEELAEETAIDSPTEDAVTDRQQKLNDRVETVTNDLNELRVTLSDLKSDIKSHRDKAEELDTRASEHDSSAEELREEIAEKEETVSETRERLESKKETISEAKATFDDAPIAFGEASAHLESKESTLTEAKKTKRELEQKVTAIQKDIQEAETLLEEGKCPECGQDVEGSPHVDTLAEDKETLESLTEDLKEATEAVETAEERVERTQTLVDAEHTAEKASNDKESVESLLEEREDAITSLKEDAKEHATKAEELREEATARREKADSLEESFDTKTEEKESLTTEKKSLTAEQEVLDTIESHYNTIEAAQSTISNSDERLDDIEGVLETFRKQLDEKVDRAETLREDVDEDRLDNAQKTMETAETNANRFNARIEQLQSYRAQLDETRGGLKNQLNTLEELESEHAELEAAVERLNRAYDEAEELEAMYQDLRHELRKKNVKHLERLLNEIFDLIYETDTYAKIELSDTYEFTVYEKGGETLKPGELSGGEKALFNLSLRTAIFQLLIEGIDSGAPMPPLILDEPTVHLDDNHVDRISDLVRRMRDLGVEQTLVISHNDEIVDAADERIEVQKNSSTNRSSVHTESKDLLAGL